MEKSKDIFCDWNLCKINLENNNIKHIVKKRQFWLFYVWVNLWNEESKISLFIRPWLVVNNFMKWDLLLIVPLTSKFNENLKDIYYKIDWNIYWLNKDSYLLLNQFKIISKKRLIRKLNDKDNIPLFDNNSFLEVLKEIKKFI